MMISYDVKKTTILYLKSDLLLRHPTQRFYGGNEIVVQPRRLNLLYISIGWLQIDAKRGYKEVILKSKIRHGSLRTTHYLLLNSVYRIYLC